MVRDAAIEFGPWSYTQAAVHDLTRSILRMRDSASLAARWRSSRWVRLASTVPPPSPLPRLTQCPHSCALRILSTGANALCACGRCPRKCGARALAGVRALEHLRSETAFEPGTAWLRGSDSCCEVVAGCVAVSAASQPAGSTLLSLLVDKSGGPCLEHGFLTTSRLWRTYRTPFCELKRKRCPSEHEATPATRPTATHGPTHAHEHGSRHNGTAAGASRTIRTNTLPTRLAPGASNGTRTNEHPPWKRRLR